MGRQPPYGGHTNPATPDDGRRAVHVWVRRPGYNGEEQLPGLLLMWRPGRTRSGASRWEGWVVFAATGHPEGGGPVLRQEWVEAAAISLRR
jgi:hypothetical protein